MKYKKKTEHTTCEQAPDHRLVINKVYRIVLKSKQKNENNLAKNDS